ncbi:OLC1v1025631C3 [Oldenlandia corymbosa var. corymbosa]|nr:OLC1v1025631C3 [Oldenlandia corymbosa var. corymbosa]
MAEPEQTAVYDIEYRVDDDDAWYSVSVALSADKETLSIAFEGLAERQSISAGDFETVAEVDEMFFRKFRPVSKQLQDYECHRVIKGMTVCAALSFGSDDLRFYDAVVEEVEHKKHSFADGEEECLCSFMLCWLHGPMSGSMALGKIAGICAIQTAALNDPRITTFSNLTKERIRNACSECKYGGPSSCKEHINHSSDQKSASKRKLQDSEVESFNQKERKELDLGVHIDPDEDMGGSDSVNSGGCYFLLIDNLEKDLSTSAISQFILGNTLASPRAYLFPRKPYLASRAGAIASDSKENIRKIHDFLVHSEHLIVSASGRPWVVHDEVLDSSCGEILGGLLSRSQDQFQWPSLKQELKVVYSGTEAYNTAKQLRDLFVDFLHHEQLLYERLVLKETEILKSSQTGQAITST